MKVKKIEMGELKRGQAKKRKGNKKCPCPCRWLDAVEWQRVLEIGSGTALGRTRKAPRAGHVRKGKKEGT